MKNTQAELKAAVKITPQQFHKLTASVPRYIYAVICGDGAPNQVLMF